MAVLAQAPEDQKINYGLALLKGLFHNWLTAKHMEESMEQQAAEPQPDANQAAAQPSGYVFCCNHLCLDVALLLSQ